MDDDDLDYDLDYDIEQLEPYDGNGRVIWLGPPTRSGVRVEVQDRGDYAFVMYHEPCPPGGRGNFMVFRKEPIFTF